MRQVRDILRMKHEAGLAVREIARRSGVPRRTVRALLERCAARGLALLDAGARHDLLELLKERYGRRSLIIISQLPVDKWQDFIGDPTYADAILDRVAHTAHRINLSGHSLRRTRIQATPNKQPPTNSPQQTALTKPTPQDFIHAHR